MISQQKIMINNKKQTITNSHHVNKTRAFVEYIIENNGFFERAIGKRPITSRSKRTKLSNTTQIYHLLKQNVSLRYTLPEGWICIDLDIHKYKLSPNDIQILQENLIREIKACFIFSTPSGGFHLLFKNNLGKISGNLVDRMLVCGLNHVDFIYPEINGVTSPGLENRPVVSVPETNTLQSPPT
jgi:hypothetical protein